MRDADLIEQLVWLLFEGAEMHQLDHDVPTFDYGGIMLSMVNAEEWTAKHIAALRRTLEGTSPPAGPRLYLTPPGTIHYRVDAGMTYLCGMGLSYKDTLVADDSEGQRTCKRCKKAMT